MRVPWNPNITGDQECLVELVLDAHSILAERNNTSTVAIKVCAQSGCGFDRAIIGALSTIGATHAPLEQAMDTLNGSIVYVQGKIPGWGCDFVKGEPEPIWRDIDTHIMTYNPDIYERMDRITMALHKAGKKVFPNAACYTAAAAIITKCPKKLVSWFLIQGRLSTWAHEFSKQ